MGRMIDELEITWEEEIMAYSRYFPGIGLEELRKITKISVRIASGPADITTEYIQNTSREITAPKFG
jgi:hypothetical protein